MSNLLEVIQAINIQGKKIRKITRNDKTYDNEELKSFHKDLKESSYLMKGFKIVIKESLSRRRALIVILQEYFFKDIVYPKDMIFEFYENKANSRFIVENRDKTAFKTPQEACKSSAKSGLI